MQIKSTIQSTMKLLEHNPVIAAVRDVKHIDTALKSAVQVIFLMGGRLSNVREITQKVQDAGKQIFLHVELIKGLGRDSEAIEYLANNISPNGIVTTKPMLLKVAAKHNMATVLQIFMIDSQAFDSGLKNIVSLGPDAVEIMPGLMPQVIGKLKSQVAVPIITAGLIKLPHEVKMMQEAGCDGITVSEQTLWDFIPPQKVTSKNKHL